MTKFSVARRSQPIIDHFLAILGTRPAKSYSLLPRLSGSRSGLTEMSRGAENMMPRCLLAGCRTCTSASGSQGCLSQQAPRGLTGWMCWRFRRLRIKLSGVFPSAQRQRQRTGVHFLSLYPWEFLKDRRSGCRGCHADEKPDRTLVRYGVCFGFRAERGSSSPAKAFRMTPSRAVGSMVGRFATDNVKPRSRFRQLLWLRRCQRV